MGLHVVVEMDEFSDLLLKNSTILLTVLVVTDTLFSQCAVEAFNVCLLILLVGACGPMALAMEE